MNGEFLYDNLLISEAAVFAGANWILPLENLLDRAMIARPARCSTPASAVVQVDFGRAITLSRWFFAHLTVTLSATYAIRASSSAAHDGDILDQAPQRIWTRVMPSMALPWDDPGWWRGLPRERDMAQYSRHLWIPLEKTRARYWQVSIQDPTSSAGYVDIGYAMAGQPVTLAYNYELGRRRLRRSRSIIEHTPGGGVIAARRRPLRGQAVRFALLNQIDAARLSDVGQAVDLIVPVLFVPRPDDHRDILRDVYPARLITSA
ncbi:MAG: hypothetical protein PHS60_11800, partial [Zavarzinia sp.]|nr:hypothetical protein [Zavarzinia sp.]